MFEKEKIKTVLGGVFSKQNIFWGIFFAVAIMAWLAYENANLRMLKFEHDKFLSSGDVAIKESVIQKIIKGDDSSKLTPEELASYYDYELSYESIIRERINSKEYARKHPEPKILEVTTTM